MALRLPRAGAGFDVYDPATGRRAGAAAPARIHLRGDSVFVGVAR